MNSVVEPQPIPEVLLIKSTKISDERGFFSETFRVSWLAEFGFDRQFVQENHSMSVGRHVLRGLHFQSGSKAQDKIVRCLRGRILDVAVDIRHGSPTFGKHVAVELDDQSSDQLLIPIGFAHGFLTLEPNCEVLYKTTDYYAPDNDKGIIWDDPQVNIKWGCAAADLTLSAKDKVLPSLNDLPEYFSYDGAGYECRIGREK